MQDRYTADVGDFGKYGLLRQLSGVQPEATPQLGLGMIWYLTDDAMAASDPPNDGKHTAYLDAGHEARFRACDPNLYGVLRTIIRSGDRRVAAVTASGVLGANVVSFEQRLGTPRAATPIAARGAGRQRWLDAALAATEPCELVFLDPDNGLEAGSVPFTGRRAPKFAYLRELRPFVERGQSVVVYHHLGRMGTHAEQIASWQTRLESEFPSSDLFTLRFRRGTSRAYFVLPAQRHRDVLRGRARDLVASPWAPHFELH